MLVVWYVVAVYGMQECLLSLRPGGDPLIALKIT